MADAPSLGAYTPQRGGRQIQTRFRNSGGGGGVESGSSGAAYSEPQQFDYDAWLNQMSGGGGEGGGDGNFGKMLMQLLAGGAFNQQDRESPSDIMTTQKMLRDPEEFARRQYNAQTYAAPFAEGGLFEGRMAADMMSPEQILASQGNTAANQWAQMGPNADAQRAANMARQMFGSGRAYYGG